MQYELNSAKKEEWKEVADLEAESFPADEAASPETIQFRIANAGKYFFTYRNREGELAGFVNGTCIVGLALLHDSMTNHEPAGRTLVIHSVTVRESLRRHHLGTAMLKEYILKIKEELSIDYILLLSKAHMLSFYVNCGFQINKLSDVSHGQDKWFELKLDLTDLRAVEQVQVDAFTSRAFGGNPAAVIFEHRDVEWMQNVAMENNLAETSFLSKVAGEEDTYALRWFTPTVEVELCGHATLAAAHALYETKRVSALRPISFRTIHSGVLTATGQADGSIELNFPVTPVTPVVLSEELQASLRAALSVTDAEILSTGKSIYDLVVEVTREAFARLAGTSIDFAKICEQGGRAVVVTCLGGARAAAVDLSALPPTPARTPQASIVNDKQYDFLSRAFVPRYGINEDPVTGSAHCALAPYWTARVRALQASADDASEGEGALLTLQGYQASGRGGAVRVTVDGERVRLAGHGVTTMRCKVVA